MDEKKGNYSFFQNRECEYFPCHPGVKKEDFNCLFCYCPLYALGKNCGGAFTYDDKGIKDCSRCLIPHRRENYDYILKKYPDILRLMQKIDRENSLNP